MLTIIALNLWFKWMLFVNVIIDQDGVCDRDHYFILWGAWICNFKDVK